MSDVRAKGVLRVDWLSRDLTRTDLPICNNQHIKVKDIVCVMHPAVLELRATASYNVQGGILADKIGYGKTATTIGLIDCTLHPRRFPELPPCDAGKFIPASGTLIIVPSNLFDQWLTEIAKFVYDGKPFRGNMKDGWSPKQC